MLEGGALIALVACLFGALIVGLAAHAAAYLRTGRASMIRWLPLMPLYYPLATFAACKAAVEVLFCPFWWHKTAHGQTAPDPVRSRDRAANPV